MDKVSRSDWRDATQGAIQKAISDCFEGHTTGGWQENTITHQVLQALGTAKEVRWAEQPFQCVWRAFKASGQFETANGDIAMRVTLRTDAGRSLVGTKYFEAKKLSPDSYRYDAIDIAQFERMHPISGHEVLLYTLMKAATKVVGEAICLPTPVAAMLHTNHPRLLHPAAHSFVGVFMQALAGRGLNFDRRQATAFDEKLTAMEASYVLEASVATPEFELTHVPAPHGYEEFDDREPDPADDYELTP